MNNRQDERECLLSGKFKPIFAQKFLWGKRVEKCKIYPLPVLSSCFEGFRRKLCWLSDSATLVCGLFQPSGLTTIGSGDFCWEADGDWLTDHFGVLLCLAGIYVLGGFDWLLFLEGMRVGCGWGELFKQTDGVGRVNGISDWLEVWWKVHYKILERLSKIFLVIILIYFTYMSIKFKV